MNAWWMLLGGLFCMMALFTIAWTWARKLDHYSMVDAVWAFGIGVTSIGWLALGERGWKTGVAVAMIAAWSWRLGSHLVKRIRKGYPHEDSRYDELREKWHSHLSVAFFGFYQMQALSTVLLALPFLMIATDQDASWSAWETVGIMVFSIGLIGEAVADAQMSRFKKQETDHRKVCRDGLWRYSRHPNYFFESVIWLGIYLFACGSDHGWLTPHAPVIIVFLLLKVTGIPPTEASSLKRKGDAYRHYQKTTSAFIPWPPREDG